MGGLERDYCIRIHHVRPRFKSDIENVLIYMATEISKLEPQPDSNFAESLNAAIRNYPGNSRSTLKTINNWRTEISALFGFIVSEDGISRPGHRAIELAENQDLIAFFKTFLFYFQYPGAHIKPHEVKFLIESGVHFKPAQYILRVLSSAEESTGTRIGITKAEACHCILNDLRCVRDNCNPLDTWQRIFENREEEIGYDTRGDVIRYAGDIIDYMEIANLLVTHDGYHYYLNNLETTAIQAFLNSSEWFSGYDEMIESRNGDIFRINELKSDWFSYVNREIGETDFSTDVLTLIASDSVEYDALLLLSHQLLEDSLEKPSELSTKEIGDFGENLVYGHECARVKNGGRDDLIHLIKRIPNTLAVGYDIQSVELDEIKRYIEVKTTISAKPITFNRITLTTNEWNAAKTMKDRYFIYRLLLTKTDKKLFIMQNPIQLYKDDKIEMTPREGAEITFNPGVVGNFEELLFWQN